MSVTEMYVTKMYGRIEAYEKKKKKKKKKIL